MCARLDFPACEHAPEYVRELHVPRPWWAHLPVRVCQCQWVSVWMCVCAPTMAMSENAECGLCLSVLSPWRFQRSRLSGPWARLALG